MQFLNSKAIGQSAGIPDLQTVAEKHDLHTCIARVVTVRYGIGNRLGYRTLRQFVLHRSVRREVAFAHTCVNTRHDKTHRLVNHLKERTGKDLVIADGLFHFRSIELRTADFRCAEEALRVFGKKQ